MVLVRNSEKRLEPSKNLPRNAFKIMFYGIHTFLGTTVEKFHWTVFLKSLKRMSLNSHNGITMIPALVKLGMKILYRWNICIWYAAYRLFKNSKFSSHLSSKIQFWLPFETSKNLSKSVPLRSAHYCPSRSYQSQFFFATRPRQKALVSLDTSSTNRTV